MKTIAIPKEIFENIFFAEGGEKNNLNKALTGEYQFALDAKEPIAEPNAEIEGGEYIQDSQGIRKAEGKSHERGGMPVKLEDGTKIVSNHLQIGIPLAKYLKETFNIEVKATDTYSKVLDKYTKKIGLQELNDKLEKNMDLMEHEKKSNTHKDTEQLNEQYISKQINELTKQKEPLEKERESLFSMLFQAQESTKEQPNQNSGFKMEMGGRVQELANKHGISPERAQELLNLHKFQGGGEEDDYGTTSTPGKVKITGERGTDYAHNQYEKEQREKQHATGSAYGKVTADTALQELYRNFPDLVQNDATLKNYIDVDNRGNVKFKGGIKLNQEQGLVKALQQKMDTRMRASSQNIINNSDYYGKDAVAKAQNYLQNQTFDDKSLARGFDSKLGQFTSGRYSMAMNLVTPEDKKFLSDNGIFTLKQLKDSPLRSKLSPDSLRNITETEKQIGTTDADYAINQFQLESTPAETTPDPEKPKTLELEKQNHLGVLSIPQRIPNFPTLQEPIKFETRYNRKEATHISPTQQLAESDAVNKGVMNQLSSNLSGSDLSLAGIGLAASSAANRNKVMSETNRYNAAADERASDYNNQIGDREQDAENNNAGKYQELYMRGIANYENDLNNMYNRDFEDQVNNWKYVDKKNWNNAYNPEVQDTGYGYQTNYKTDLGDNQTVKNLANAGLTPVQTANKERGISIENPANNAQPDNPPFAVTPEEQKMIEKNRTKKKFGGRFKKK